MSNQDGPFGEIEPEVARQIEASTRDALVKYGSLMLTGGISTLFAAASTEAFGVDGLPQQVVDVLNYALTLEHFEATFCRTANAKDGLIPPKYRGLFLEIGEHEGGHVALLSNALGKAAVKPSKFEFTG